MIKNIKKLSGCELQQLVRDMTPIITQLGLHRELLTHCDESDIVDHIINSDFDLDEMIKVLFKAIVPSDNEDELLPELDDLLCKADHYCKEQDFFAQEGIETLKTLEEICNEDPVFNAVWNGNDSMNRINFPHHENNAEVDRSYSEQYMVGVLLKAGHDAERVITDQFAGVRDKWLNNPRYRAALLNNTSC